MVAAAEEGMTAASQPEPVLGTAVAGNGETAEGVYEYRHFLERLAVEIQRTFAVNFIRSPVQMICVTGGNEPQPRGAAVLLGGIRC